MGNFPNSHGSPSGYEEGKIFATTIPSDWVLISPVRIGYCKTMFEKFSETERKIINFYMGGETFNNHTFDFTNISHLQQLLELEGKSGREIPSLDFILDSSNLLMVSLMNHLVGENANFSVIGVSGGGPYALHIAKMNPSRISSLHLIVGIVRNMIIIRGETTRSFKDLEIKLEKGNDPYLIYDKKNATDLILRYQESYRDSSEESFRIYSWDPFFSFQKYPNLLRWGSYSLYRILSMKPSLTLYVFGVSSDSTKLQSKCFPKMDENFTNRNIYNVFLLNFAFTQRKTIGYLFDMYLFLNMASDRKKYLSSIKVPTQILASIYDKNVDFDENAFYAFKHLPNSQLVAYGDCGHFFFANQIESVTQNINNFRNNN